MLALRFPVETFPPSGEQELKFHIPRHSSPALRRWMEGVFRGDVRHAASTICSVYFDTPDRVSYREKEASHYRKAKYRLRWYADETGRPSAAPAFLEVKEKQGAVRRKCRTALPMPAAEVAAAPLTDAFFLDLFRRCRTAEMPLLEKDLRPVLELRYHRRRYAHPVFRETFCLDSDIRCVRTHPSCLPAADGRVLGHDVFEQKGGSPDPLPPLQALPRFGARRASLSKYFLVIRQLHPEYDTA